MSVEEVKALLARVRIGGDVPVVEEEIAAVLAEVTKPDLGDSRNRPISADEAKALRDLGSAHLSPGARRLLDEFIDKKLPNLLAPAAAQPTSGSKAAVTLEGHGGVAVGVLASGALKLDASAAADPLVEAAAVLSLQQLESEKNPFASVKDAKLLKKVADWHLRMYAEVRDGKRLKGENAYTLVHARAALLAVSRLAVERLLELRATKANRALGERLTEVAASEPHVPLRKHEVYRLLVSPELGKLGAVKAAEPEVFPSAPPYDAWRKDRVLKVKAYCDDDGGPWRSQVWIFQNDLGMEVIAGSTDDPDKPVTFAKDVAGDGGGFERIEVTLAPRPKKGSPPSLFENIGDDDIDVIIYSGHAGYGQRVDAALRKGVQTDGAGKLVMLFQCWGAGNLESLSRAFPSVQLFSTVDSSTAWSDDRVIVQALEAFAAGKQWEELMQDLTWTAKNPDRSGWKKLYFAPSTRPVIERRYDVDKDGTAIDSDRVYLEPVKTLLSQAATGFNPVPVAVPAYSLDAGGVTGAVNDTSLILRYNQLGLKPRPKAGGDVLELGPNTVVNGGFFTPKAGDHHAFSFEPTVIDGTLRLRVRASTAFAHAQPEELKNFLAYELGYQLAAWSGKNEQECTAYGLATYLQSLYQYKSEWESYALLDDEAIEHALFLKRYGLPALPLRGFLHALSGDHPELTAANLPALIASFQEKIGRADGKPRPFGTAMTAPDPSISFHTDGYGWELPVDKMKELLRSLPGHAQDEVLNIAPRNPYADGPRTVQVRGADGRRRVLLVDIDGTTKKPRQIYDLGDAIDLRHTMVESVAVHLETWVAALWKDDTEAAKKGEALLALIEAEVAKETPLPRLAELLREQVKESGGAEAELHAVFGSNHEYLADVFPAAEVEAVKDVLWRQVYSGYGDDY